MVGIGKAGFRRGVGIGVLGLSFAVVSTTPQSAWALVHANLSGANFTDAKLTGALLTDGEASGGITKSPKVARLTRNAPALPGPPTTVDVSVGQDSASISWTAPTSDGGSLITSYTVTPSPKCKSCKGLTVTGSPAATKTTVTGLTGGTSYTFTVKATNSKGTGPSSTPSNAVIPFIFDAAFPGTTLSSAWDVVTGSNPNNDEQECYATSEVSVSDGLLHEKAAVGTVKSCYCPPTPPSTATCPYISGAVQWSSLSFTYGIVSVRAKFAGGQGTWPAIWLLGKDCQQPEWIEAGSSCDWPKSGSNEIDIAEIQDSDHTQVNQQFYAENSAGTEQSPACHATTLNVSDYWHTYTVIWKPGSITWEIDGRQTCKVTSTFVPSTPMFLIINTAVGGAGSGSVDKNTLPQSTEIASVGVS